MSTAEAALIATDVDDDVGLALGATARLARVALSDFAVASGASAFIFAVSDVQRAASGPPRTPAHALGAAARGRMDLSATGPVGDRFINVAATNNAGIAFRCGFGLRGSPLGLGKHRHIVVHRMVNRARCGLGGCLGPRKHRHVVVHRVVNGAVVPAIVFSHAAFVAVLAMNFAPMLALQGFSLYRALDERHIFRRVVVLGLAAALEASGLGHAAFSIRSEVETFGGDVRPAAGAMGASAALERSKVLGALALFIGLTQVSVDVFAQMLRRRTAVLLVAVTRLFARVPFVLAMNMADMLHDFAAPLVEARA